MMMTDGGSVERMKGLWESMSLMSVVTEVAVSRIYLVCSHARTPARVRRLPSGCSDRPVLQHHLRVDNLC